MLNDSFAGQHLNVGESSPRGLTPRAARSDTPKGTAFMAQRTQVILIDDIDGGKADETVTFALDGTTYQIDLSTYHAGELRNAIGP